MCVQAIPSVPMWTASASSAREPGRGNDGGSVAAESEYGRHRSHSGGGNLCGTPYVGPGSGVANGAGIVRETTGVLNDCREGDVVDTTDIDLWALQSWYEAYLADNGYGALADSGF